MAFKIKEIIEDYFHIKELNTDIKTEIIAGITTFFTMAYIIVVNPIILSAGGFPKEGTTIATILIAIFGTLLMGVYAKRPFAIAPYMGENAFIAYTVCKVMGYNWQTALGAVFIGGMLFVILTILKLRSWFAKAIPNCLKYAFTAGLGLFLCFIGLNNTGLVELGIKGAPVRIGNLHSPQVLITIFTIFIMGILIMRRVKGALFLGIVISTILAWSLGLVKISSPSFNTFLSIKEVFMKLDILGALQWGFFSVILSLFVMDFIDTIGTLIGVGVQANLLDKDGNLPDIEKPLLCDALSTCAGALLGTTTSGTYIESAAGIQEGGRSGLVSVVVAFLFFLALFFTPFFTFIPSYCVGPALIIVGITMIKSIRRINLEDFSEFFPAGMVMILISFTYNMGIGITAGFIIYCLVKIFMGRFKDLNLGVILLALLSLVFYIFYPY